MAILDSLLTYLQAQGHGTPGVDLWLARMGDSGPDLAVCLYEYDGQNPVETMKPGLALERPRIQVVARASKSDYLAARNKLVAVRASLGAITDQTLSGLRVVRVQPVGAACVPLPDDASARTRVSCSFNVVHE